MHNKPVKLLGNGKCLLSCFGCLHRDIKKQGKHWGTLVEWDTSTTVNILDIKFTPLEQSLKEMGDTMFKFGIVKEPANNK